MKKIDLWDNFGITINLNNMKNETLMAYDHDMYPKIKPLPKILIREITFFQGYIMIFCKL